MTDYNEMEMLIVTAARELKNGATVGVGTGAPCAAPEDTGPHKIITNMAVMDFEPDSKRMRVISLNPGYAFGDVQENCGFELLFLDRLDVTPPPTPLELEILRNQVDPKGMIIGR